MEDNQYKNVRFDLGIFTTIEALLNEIYIFVAVPFFGTKGYNE